MYYLYYISRIYKYEQVKTFMLLTLELCSLNILKVRSLF